MQPKPTVPFAETPRRGHHIDSDRNTPRDETTHSEAMTDGPSISVDIRTGLPASTAQKKVDFL